MFFLDYQSVLIFVNYVIFTIKYIACLLINYYTLPGLLHLLLVTTLFLAHLLCVKHNTRVVFFKNQFRHITFYSMPFTILLILRKRLNFIFLVVL